MLHPFHNNGLHILSKRFNASKPVFGVSDTVRLKPVSSATETSQKIENLLVARLDMILSNKRITKALIRLRGANTKDRFSRIEAHILYRITLSRTLVKGA